MLIAMPFVDRDVHPTESNEFEDDLDVTSIPIVQLEEEYTEARCFPTPILPDKHSEKCVAAMHLSRVENSLIRWN